jgi:hypothetical protein
MNFLILSLLYFLDSAFANIKSEFSGNVEAQTRHAWNNPNSDEAPLNQDWKETNFHLMYGNFAAKISDEGYRLNTNVFGRYSRSDLYQDNYFATQIYNFPNKLVARDVFKMFHRDSTGRDSTEIVVNKFFLEIDHGTDKFSIGRLYINYGLGEIFNPINPFNQPTGLTAIAQIAQGNDGINFTFFKSDVHTMNFYFLGDKRIDGYEGEINRTLWLHGEYRATDKLQYDYVIGDDQRRNKIGGQISYSGENALVYLQGLYQSKLSNEVDSHKLVDITGGHDQQLTNKWHLRIEAGYQEQLKISDPVALQTQATSLGNRFLPAEYFVAVANIYEVHPLVKLGGTIIGDIKSGYNYFVTRNSFNLSKNTEAELFAYLPLSKGEKVSLNNLTPISTSQNLITTDIGLALRAFF